MSLLILPNELLFHIAGCLEQHIQVYAMARSCRQLYYLLRRYLLQHNVRYSEGSALIWAAKKDRRSLVRRLLRLGAVVNTRGRPLHPGTPLHYAAAAGHLGMVELLLKKGGDPEGCGINGYTPLLLALWKRHDEIAIFLFSKMSDPDIQIAGDAGYTPLHVACLRQLPYSARVFLKSDADVNVRTSKSSTPLHLALESKASDKSNDTIRSCTLELVILLLEFGADIDTRATNLGMRHPDPQVREIFGGNKSSSPSKAPFIRIGRPWWVEDSSNADHAFSPTPANLSYSWLQQPTNASEEDDFTMAAEDLLNDKVFPVLNPSRALQVSSSAWHPSKVKEIRRTVLMNESTDGEASSSRIPVEPFPKLIGRKFPHPLQNAAQLSWRELRSPKMQLVTEELCTNSKGEIQEASSQAGQGSKKRRWRPLQLT